MCDIWFSHLRFRYYIHWFALKFNSKVTYPTEQKRVKLNLQMFFSSFPFPFRPPNKFYLRRSIFLWINPFHFFQLVFLLLMKQVRWAAGIKALQIQEKFKTSLFPLNLDFAEEKPFKQQKISLSIFIFNFFHYPFLLLSIFMFASSFRRCLWIAWRFEMRKKASRRISKHEFCVCRLCLLLSLPQLRKPTQDWRSGEVKHERNRKFSNLFSYWNLELEEAQHNTRNSHKSSMLRAHGQNYEEYLNDIGNLDYRSYNSHCRFCVLFWPSFYSVYRTDVILNLKLLLWRKYHGKMISHLERTYNLLTVHVNDDKKYTEKTLKWKGWVLRGQENPTKSNKRKRQRNRISKSFSLLLHLCMAQIPYSTRPWSRSKNR